jgi:glucose/arabinose dehydrogenase
MTVLMPGCKTKEDDVIEKELRVAVAPQISLTSVITSGLSAPMQFVNAGDSSKRIFIVQKAGTVRVYDSTFNFLSVFGTVSNVSTTGERGLLSMAFHPNYSTNGFVYVYYTNTAGNLELARYHV